MTHWNLRRRELLAGLGAGAGLLPFLTGTQSFAAEPIFPKRLIIVVAPNGYPVGQYVPSGTGDRLSGLIFSEALSPLDPWKEQLTLLAPLTCPNMKGSEDFHRAYSMMFTGLPPVDASLRGPSSVWAPTGPTLDQVIARAVTERAQLPLRSLALQLPFGSPGGPDAKLEALRSFWIGQNQPVTPEGNPYKVMDAHFAGKVPGDPTMDRIRAERRSMLDFLGRDLERFAGALGTEDRLGVRGHLQGVRDIEKQLSTTLPAVPRPASATGQPIDHTSQRNYPALLDINLDLVVAALRSDLTRVATVQLASAWGDALSFPWLPGTGGGSWHSIAHNEPGKKLIIDQWMMSQFAALIKRLASVPEVGANSKTMLDNTVVLWATTMLTGGHTPKLPWMLAGSCGGYFKTGQYLRAAADLPANHVMVDLCSAMGVPVTHFGDPTITGVVPGLKA